MTLRGLPLVGVKMRNVKADSGAPVRGPAIAKLWWASPSHSVILSAQLGKQLKFGKGLWTVVGVIDAGQSAVNSEIWGDGNQVAQDFNRPDLYSSALLQVDR